MKLELKHLAPYLPYGLKIGAVKNFEGIRIMDSDIENSDKIVNIGACIRLQYKPILRPLSDLATSNKVLDLLYEECQGIDENIDYWCEFEGDITNTSISFRASQILFNHHFDVFGLIEAGLAIDINKALN